VEAQDLVVVVELQRLEPYQEVVILVELGEQEQQQVLIIQLQLMLVVAVVELFRQDQVEMAEEVTVMLLLV
tara:strand:- start:14 stop:226 length:213 start_codon:yes stop_codon:yes gene_type:complete